MNELINIRMQRAKAFLLMKDKAKHKENGSRENECFLTI